MSYAGVWKFYSDTREWQSYTPDENSLIEEALIEGKRILQLGHYELDLYKLIQRSTESGMTRKIRRFES
jgi:hypothetical protein